MDCAHRFIVSIGLLFPALVVSNGPGSSRSRPRRSVSWAIQPRFMLIAIRVVAKGARARVARWERRLLVVSQAPVAAVLFASVTTSCRGRADWEVTIRPHPSESAESGCGRRTRRPIDALPGRPAWRRRRRELPSCSASILLRFSRRYLRGAKSYFYSRTSSVVPMAAEGGRRTLRGRGR